MNVAREVERWLSKRAYVRYCLSRGLVNRSALARLIAKDLGVSGQSKFDAIHVAVRRFEDGIEPDRPAAESVLQRSRLEVRTGMGVAIGRNEISQVWDLARSARRANEEFHILQEPGVWTVIAPMSRILELKDVAFKVHSDVVELVVKSPRDIESTPGVLAEISERLAQAGVNVIEVLSCWTDSILIVERRDMQKAIDALDI